MIEESSHPVSRAEHTRKRGSPLAINVGAARVSRCPASTTSRRFETRPDLPGIRTRLIGREDELLALADLLQRDDVALVTVIGPGGVGKTRLTIALADRMREAFRGDIWFIALASMTDPAAMSSTIAFDLGVLDSPEPLVLHRLMNFIRDRQALLVLDNVERLTAAAADLAMLLTRCENLKVLVTSRVPLHLAEEQRFRIAPLPVRRDGEAPGEGDPDRSFAAQLFAQRARMVRTDFRLTDGNAALVETICQRIDGLPLAIELAAARCSTLSLREIRDRLDTRLTLLTHGPRDRPERLSSLRSAIAWSYDLLEPDEQRLLRWLSVFAGGWTLEAAARVIGDPSPAANATLESMAALVDASLVDRSGGIGDTPRFTMLETIREFALGQLETGEELERARTAHAGYFASFGDDNLPNRVGPRDSTIVFTASRPNGPIFAPRWHVSRNRVTKRACFGWPVLWASSGISRIAFAKAGHGWSERWRRPHPRLRPPLWHAQSPHSRCCSGPRVSTTPQWRLPGTTDKWPNELGRV